MTPATAIHGDSHPSHRSYRLLLVVPDKLRRKAERLHLFETEVVLIAGKRLARMAKIDTFLMQFRHDGDGVLAIQVMAVIGDTRVSWFAGRFSSLFMATASEGSPWFWICNSNPHKDLMIPVRNLPACSSFLPAAGCRVRLPRRRTADQMPHGCSLQPALLTRGIHRLMRRAPDGEIFVMERFCKQNHGKACHAGIVQYSISRPMIGLIPALTQRCQGEAPPRYCVCDGHSRHLTAPPRTRSSMQQAPSSQLYSLWTCRWTKDK